MCWPTHRPTHWEIHSRGLGRDEKDLRRLGRDHTKQHGVESLLISSLWVSTFR